MKSGGYAGGRARRPLLWMGVLALGLGGAGAAAAQGAPTAPQANQPPVGQAPQARQVVGEAIMGSQGEMVGRVKQVVREPQSQRLMAVVGAGGGFLGIGGKDVVVPLDRLRVVTKAELAARQGTPLPQPDKGQAVAGSERGATRRVDPELSRQAQMEEGREIVVMAPDLTREALQKLPEYHRDAYQPVPAAPSG